MKSRICSNLNEKWQTLSETSHLEQDLDHKVSLICEIWTELNLKVNQFNLFINQFLI